MEKVLNPDGITHIISDWDGTIVDSMGDLAEAFTATLQNAYQIDDAQALTKSFYDNAGSPWANQVRVALRNIKGLEIEDTDDIESDFTLSDYSRLLNRPRAAF